MDARIVGSGNISVTAAPCLEYLAYLSRIGRAGQRTRTADLLITSDHSGVAGGCRGLQMPHI
jgi:hypothetical protein